MHQRRYPGNEGRDVPEQIAPPSTPPPERRSSSRLGTIISRVVVAGIALDVLAVNNGVGLDRLAQGTAPEATVRAFCTDEAHQAAHGAYVWLASQATSRTPDEFVQANEQRDAQLGTVQSCEPAGRDEYQTLLGPYEAVSVTKVTCSRAATHSGTSGLDQFTTEDGSHTWLIANIDPS